MSFFNFLISSHNLIHRVIIRIPVEVATKSVRAATRRIHNKSHIQIMMMISDAHLHSILKLGVDVRIVFTLVLHVWLVLLRRERSWNRDCT